MAKGADHHKTIIRDEARLKKIQDDIMVKKAELLRYNNQNQIIHYNIANDLCLKSKFNTI